MGCVRKSVRVSASLLLAVTAALLLAHCGGDDDDAPVECGPSAGGSGNADSGSAARAGRGGSGSGGTSAAGSGSGGTAGTNGGTAGTGGDGTGAGGGGTGSADAGDASDGDASGDADASADADASGSAADAGGEADAGGNFAFRETYRGPSFDPDGGLSRGWTSVMSYVERGEAQFVFYDTYSGVARGASLRQDMQGVVPVWTADAWYTGFSHLAPYYVGREPYFVIYHPSLTSMNFQRLPRAQLPQFLNQVPIPGLPYNELIPFRENDTNYLFWYSWLDGAVRLDRIADDGANMEISFESGWDYTASHAAGFSTPQGWFALMFKAIREEAFVLRVYTDGVEQVASAPFSDPFSLLTYYEFEGRYFVLLYGQDGASGLYEFNPSLLTFENVWRGSLHAGANVVTSFIHEQKPYLLLSDRAAGVVSFVAIDHPRKAGDE
jgi:hypothetical protein